MHSFVCLIYAGMIRYAPPTYPQMLRPTYPPRPPGAIGVIPTLQRPPVMLMRGPVIPTIVRPPVNLAVAQTEKPMTTIYVGKIASTVDNDFMLSLLQVRLLSHFFFNLHKSALLALSSMKRQIYPCIDASSSNDSM